ncbi:MAG: hypothetical protein ACXVB9_09010 [Bdellovibrionota bacterium]
MNKIFPALTLLFGFNAFALGPIPNGTYKGTETCNGMSFPSALTLTDKTMAWGGQVNSFEFGPNSNGFFTLKPISGQTGSGQGHFTDNGLHYEVTYDYVADDGTTHPAPGEDTFTYAKEVIHLDSSASAGPKGKFVCTGDFALAH